jgi:hypothetical protein
VGGCPKGALRDPPFGLVGSGFAGPTRDFFGAAEGRCFELGRTERASAASERVRAKLCREGSRFQIELEHLRAVQAVGPAGLAMTALGAQRVDQAEVSHFVIGIDVEGA